MNTTNTKSIMALVVTLLTLAILSDSAKAETNSDPTLHYDANGQPFYRDRVASPARPSANEKQSDLYHLRYYVNPSVALIGGGKDKFYPNLRVAEGFEFWTEVTGNLLVREKDHASEANVLITTSDLGNDTELIRATPSKPGQFKNLKIVLNTGFKKWTPQLMKAAIAHGVGAVMGVPYSNDSSQLMYRRFNGKALELGLEDIEQAQRIYGSSAPALPIPKAPADFDGPGDF